MNATILMAKRFPSEEFTVMMDNRPVVLTFRDTQYSYIDRNEEGTRVVVHDVGIWNVHTSRLPPNTQKSRRC